MSVLSPTTAALSTKSAERVAAVPLALATVYLVWSSTYLALKWVVLELPALLSVGARFLLAGGLLLGFARVRGVAWPTTRQWLAGAAAGVPLFFVGNGFVSIAEREVSSGLAAVVCGAMPLLTVSFGWFAGERASRREILGLAVGMLGVWVMSQGALAGTGPLAKLIYLAPVGWALGSLAARKLGQAPGVAGPGVQMLAGGALALLLGVLTGETWPSSASARAWLSFGYLVVFGSMVAFSAYAFLLRNARPALATSYAYINPGIAVLLGAVIGGEALTWRAALGCALVLSAVLLVSRARH